MININKFKTGKPQNSSILKDLLKNKNSSKIQSNIKNKLEEIQEKLKKFEEMAKNLGKDFNNSTNK